jgi:hypothetical protein
LDASLIKTAIPLTPTEGATIFTKFAAPHKRARRSSFSSIPRVLYIDLYDAAMVMNHKPSRRIPAIMYQRTPLCKVSNIVWISVKREKMKKIPSSNAKAKMNFRIFENYNVEMPTKNQSL